MSTSAMPNKPAADPSEILQAVQAELARKSVWLTFGPDLESRYLAAVHSSRINEFVAFGIVASIIYNLFLPIVAPLIPDTIELAVIVQLGVLTPFSLANSAAMLWRRSVNVTALSATIALPMLATLAIFGIARAPGAVFLPFTIPGFLMCGCFCLPLPFPYVCAITTLAAIALPTALLAHPSYGAAELKLTLMLNFSVYAFTLAAARRMEISGRTSYLLNLRESLRADILTHSNERLRTLSDTDGLTGIRNRRCLDAELVRLWRRAAEDSSRVGMLLIDIDHFKAFNDTYGHQAGDACLLVVADLLAEYTRLGTDIAARFGGEEFAVLMPGASLSHAIAVGERLRVAVESLSVPLDGASCSVRISVGCASLAADSQSPPACLITAADEALYCAKRTGRNRTHPAALVE